MRRRRLILGELAIISAPPSRGAVTFGADLRPLSHLPADSHSLAMDSARVSGIGSLVSLAGNSDILVGRGANRAPFGNGVRRSRGAVLRLSLEKSLVDPHYLVWALRGRFAELARREGVARLPLRPDRLLSLELDIPDLPVQSRFAKMLEAADRLRELRSRAESARSRILPATYRRHFKGEQTKGWERRPLGALVKPLTARTQPQGDDLGGERALVIGRSGNRCGAIEIVSGRRWPEDVIALVPRVSSLDIHYLAEALRDADLRRYASGSVRPHLTTSGVMSAEIVIPPADRQLWFSHEARRQEGLAAAAARSSEAVDRLWELVQTMTLGHSGLSV